jgi:hypothetical protein
MTMPVPDGMTATNVVDKYIEAIGGKDKIMAVKTTMTVSDATIQGTPLVMTNKASGPNKSSMVISVMGNAMQKIIFDGEKGYQEAQGRKIDMKPEEVEEAKKMMAPFADMAYINGKLDRIEPIDGENFYVIVLGKTEVFYSVKTGFKAKEIKTVKGPDGADVQVPSLFSDYKEVNGIKFPHTIVLKSGPMNLDFKVKEIKINEGVTDADFN